MKSRAALIAWVVLALAAAGLVASRVGQGAWSVLRRDMPVLTAGDIELAAGEGVMVGLFGGFRAVAADFLWVRTNAEWETQDLPATQTLIRLVTTVDPRPLVFWINGARMIGYDMPVWRIDALGGAQGQAVPATVQARIVREQVQAALDVLQRARIHHPDEPLLLIEMAGLLHRKLGDIEGAAALYQQAATMPGAPYYAARITAELLKQLGRDREAYAWLVQVYPTLPERDPMAMSEIVLQRIRELEEKLHIPMPERYLAPSRNGESH